MACMRPMYSVEIENKESWEWFLKHLCEDIVDSETVEGQDNEWTLAYWKAKQKGLIEALKECSSKSRP
ncbi:hypothetical protein Leryth_016250 [Lithospermum erythrorhizon]|nr:hypothetical protein Leryth_016250 [Lithospermum erythrorhizon]